MWYDLVCLAILAMSAWRGMSKGFVWQVATIAGIVVCFVFAETVSIAVAPMTGIEPPLSRWVSILGLYIVASFVAFAMARSLKSGLEQAKFEDYDRHLGGIFGALKGALLCLVLSFFMFTLSEQTRDIVFHSNAGYGSAVMFEQLQPVMPQELGALLEPYMAGFDRESIAKHREEHPEGDEEHNHNFQIDFGDSHTSENDHDHDHTNNTVETLPNPFDTKPSDPIIDRIVDSIPGLFDADLKEIVARSISQTDPEDRPELIKELSTGLPGLIRQVAEQWQNGKPATPSVTQTEDWKRHRAVLLKEISGVYTEHLDAQQTIMEEVVYALQGVPDQITVAVLEDWHADLLRTSPDPDPSTDMRTALDRRVVNQLDEARISISSLPSSLQHRLQDLK